MSDELSTTNIPIQANAPTSEEILRESLKRCSVETVQAALAFQVSKDPALVPVIVLGIIERFLDPDVVDVLRSGGDSVQFMEDLSLDSLTMMEVVMLVEESLNVSIQNEELLSLRTIGDLKVFISNKVAGIESDDSVKSYRLEDIAAIMPQQDPFLFLSKAEITDGLAKGEYRISGQESFLQGHFKDNPVFPASIMLEALGQLGVFYLLKKVCEGDEDSIFFTGADGVRCHRVCKPGETLEMSVKLKRRHDPMAVFSGTISVNGQKAVSVEEITLVCADSDQVSRNGTSIANIATEEPGKNGHG